MVSSQISADIKARRAEAQAAGDATAFLILDTESIPDGRLVGGVKYPADTLTPEAAIDRAQAEAREQSRDGSDFLPVTFQVPVAACVVRVASDFTIQAVTCLHTPEYRPEKIARKFWIGAGSLPRAQMGAF